MLIINHENQIILSKSFQPTALIQLNPLFYQKLINLTDKFIQFSKKKNLSSHGKNKLKSNIFLNQTNTNTNNANQSIYQHPKPKNEKTKVEEIKEGNSEASPFTFHKSSLFSPQVMRSEPGGNGLNTTLLNTVTLPATLSFQWFFINLSNYKICFLVTINNQCYLSFVGIFNETASNKIIKIIMMNMFSSFINFNFSEQAYRDWETGYIS